MIVDGEPGVCVWLLQLFSSSGQFRLGVVPVANQLLESRAKASVVSYLTVTMNAVLSQAECRAASPKDGESCEGRDENADAGVNKFSRRACPGEVDEPGEEA